MDLQNIFKNVFCLLIIVVHKIDAIYTLTKHVYTWSESTQVCTLATPNLVFNKNGITPDLANLLSVDAWLGYTEKMTPFEYFGCALKDDLNLNTANFTTEGDPGKCWSACNNVKAVAVYDNECYCLQDVNIFTKKLLNDECDMGCPSQPNIVCGGVPFIGREYVSLYKTTYTGPAITSETETNLCLWYERLPLAFFWSGCTKLFRMICYNEYRVWVYYGSNAYGDWKTMTTRCFSDGGIPSNYNNTKDLNTTVTAQKWTGIIRNGVIYPISNPTNVNEGKYGYVVIATGKLSFTNDTTVRKRALCVKGTIVTVETTTSTGKTTTSSGKTTTSTGKTTTSTGKTNQRSTTVKIDSDYHAYSKQDSPNIGAIVGVTLSIAVIIIVTVIIVVLWKRGIRLQVVRKAKSDSQNETAANNHINATGHGNAIQGTPEVNVHSYDEIDISDISPENTMTHVGGDNNSRDNYIEAHTYRNIESPTSNVIHTYSNIDNKHGGEHTYQNQGQETSDEAHLYLDLKNKMSDDHAYAGLEARVPRSK